MRKLLLLILLLGCRFTLSAQQLTGAEISAQCMGNQNYQFTVDIWSVGQLPATDSVYFDFGDGIENAIPVSSANSLQIGNSPYYHSTLFAAHTFMGSGPPGGYEITVITGKRITGIGNIPNSGNTVMRLRMNLIVDSFIGCNSLPVSAGSSPVDTAFISQNNQFNSGITDSDGDSLSFSLLACDDTASSGGYVFPAGLTIDSANGNYNWNSASQPGLYNVVIKTENWFLFPNGNRVLAGYSVREIQLAVLYPLGYTERQHGEISLFPNPVQSGTYLSMNNALSSNYTVQFVSMYGQSVWEESRYYSSNDLITIPELPEGLYFFELIPESGPVITHKILIRSR